MYASASGSDNAALVARVVDLLADGRAGLITDVDGTISPIVARPEDAQVLPAARHALRGLEHRLTVVAVVTGRRAVDARAMVGVDGVVIIGNHGLEMWSDTGPLVMPQALAWVPQLELVLADLRRELAQPWIGQSPSAGISIEDKVASASVHYRLAPDPELARRELLTVLKRAAVKTGLRLEEGRRVLNLLPPLAVNKGTAVAWLVGEYRLERVVFLGDDITDTHAFRALAALRQTTHLQALSIGVVGLETPPSVSELADATVGSAEAVAELLDRVNARISLRRGRTSDTMQPGAPTVWETHAW